MRRTTAPCGSERAAPLDHPALDHYVKRRISGIMLRALRWARDRAPPGIRSLAGILLMIGGVFGFLPVLGFWMLPLGAAFIALDIPATRHRIDALIERLERAAAPSAAVERDLPGPRRTDDGPPPR